MVHSPVLYVNLSCIEKAQRISTVVTGGRVPEMNTKATKVRLVVTPYLSSEHAIEKDVLRCLTSYLHYARPKIKILIKSFYNYEHFGS